MNMYDALSSDYDRFVNWGNRLAMELPFLERRLRGLDREGKPVRVLDAACGTGMHAVALAKQGFDACGADLSHGMIERARANATLAGVEVRFEPAGFGALAGTFGKGSFDALLCLGNSLPHLLNPTDLQAALADFAACLRPGGLLLLQNRNFDAVLASQQRWMEPQAYHDEEREWLFIRFYDFLPSGLIDFHILTLTRDVIPGSSSGEGWTQAVSSTQLYPLRDEELSLALHKAGFGHIERYGGLNDAAFHPSASGNLVIAAMRGEES